MARLYAAKALANLKLTGVQTDKYEDLVESGVIDPAKVTRTALQNAASIAGLMLTTEGMVAEIPEKKPASPVGHGPEHGGMDY